MGWIPKEPARKFDRRGCLKGEFLLRRSIKFRKCEIIDNGCVFCMLALATETRGSQEQKYAALAIAGRD
jgi:hypothetical protein